VSRRPKGKLAPFVALFRHTVKSGAWKALSVGARATFVALKTNYNSNAQNAVFLSARDGAKELGVSKNTAGKWLHELEHYGMAFCSSPKNKTPYQKLGHPVPRRGT
jgi:hypothetical protein